MHAQENMLTSTRAHAHIQTADINIKITNQRVGFYEKFPPPNIFLIGASSTYLFLALREHHALDEIILILPMR